MSSTSYEKLAAPEGGGYAPDVGGRKPYLHPVTGEMLPDQGKPSRIWGSQRAYLRHIVESLPAALRAGGEDAALRFLLDQAMRREFGDEYAERCRELALEEEARISAARTAKKRRVTKKRG